MKTLMIETSRMKDVKVISAEYFQLIKKSYSFFPQDMVEANENDCMEERILLQVPIKRLEQFFSFGELSKFDIMMDSNSIQIGHFFVLIYDIEYLGKLIYHIIGDNSSIGYSNKIPTGFGKGVYTPLDADKAFINGEPMNEPNGEFQFFHIDFLNMWQTIFTMY